VVAQESGDSGDRKAGRRESRKAGKQAACVCVCGGEMLHVEKDGEELSGPGCMVQLLLSCEGVKSRDVASKSDPFAELQVFDASRETWQSLGRTNYLSNVSSGAWAEAFTTKFIFEQVQRFQVQVMDHDKHSNHDHLGTAAFTLGDVMGSRGQSLKVPLATGCGSVTVSAEHSNSSGGVLRLKLSGKKFESKDWGGFGSSDPYFVLEREINSTWTRVHQSEWKDNSSSPSWKPCKLSLDHLCRCNLDTPLKLAVYDHDENTKDDLIGEAMTTVRALVEGSGTLQIPMVHPPTRSKYQKSSYNHSGLVLVNQASVHRSPTSMLLDYIAGGLQLNLVVGIDFTLSNGPPNSPDSLHYRRSDHMNQYQTAIHQVGSILQSYDSNGMVPAYGFGGEFRGNTNHGFPLNGNDNAPECHGIDGILEAYESALAHVPLSGPTIFSPLLSKAISTATPLSQLRENPAYQIVLILTDGAICDMDATISSVRQASELPMSIIIIGIGNANFGRMEDLDGDHKAYAKRDIVQFVPFSDFLDKPDRLSEEVLKELPSQIVNYFQSYEISPRPPPQAIAVPIQDESITSSSSLYPGATGPPASVLAATGRDILSEAFRL